MARWHLILLTVGAAALPMSAFAANGESVMVPSKWSLDETNKANANVKGEAQKNRRATAAANRRIRPRIIGGAQISNSRLRSKKSGASVGVAVPF